MLNKTHQRKANKNCNEVSSHMSQNGHHQKVYKQQMLERVCRKGNPLMLLVECKLAQPLWRTVWAFLKKLEIKLPYNSLIPLLGIHPEETGIERDTCTPVVIAALFTIARAWKQPRYPLANGWIRKLWYIYTVNYHPAIKSNFSSNEVMNLGPIIQSEISLKEKYKYCILMHMFRI